MRIITLLTDFGPASSYAAEMKAVLVAGCRATIVDITHDISPYDIAAGAHVLASTAATCPAGTVHLAVVDPGVGTARRPLVVAAGGHCLVGPDNGLLMVAARALGRPCAHVIDTARFASRPIAPTFHGRDVFAPAAAALASGLPPHKIGPPADGLVELPMPPPTRGAGIIRGRVLACDAFGNAITDIPGAWLSGWNTGVVFEHPRGSVAVRRVRTYGDARSGEPIVLAGSSGTVEIAVNGGRAADTFGLAAGDAVVLRSAPAS